MNRKRLLSFCFVTVTAVLATWLSIRVVSAAAKKPITAAHTRIVRAVNLRDGFICIPQVIASGNTPPVKENEDLTDLSVSCSDDRSVDYKKLEEPLKKDDRGYCVTTLGILRGENRAVKVVSDPTDDNAYHCLLSDITPKQFVAGVKEQR